MVSNAEIKMAAKVLKRHFHMMWEDTTWLMVARQVLIAAEDVRATSFEDKVKKMTARPR